MSHGREDALAAVAAGSVIADRRLLTEERLKVDALLAQLEEEREAHTQRVQRLNLRDAELRARESAHKAQLAELQAEREAFGDEQMEVEWRHWQRDRMREMMRELTAKRPTDEWRRRMERMHTALDLSERDNARLRNELSRTASMAVGHEGGPRGGGGGCRRAAAAAAVSKGGLAEDLLARHEALQLEFSQTEEALRLAKRSAASQEAYLGVLLSEAQENASRNEAQQRRLELLTAENSKLKKEATRLRSEVTNSRMANFEHSILSQELRGAKDAAAAMEAQLQRLHAENASLREGGGLRDEVSVLTQQLRDALEAKAELQAALTHQVRRAQAESAVALDALASADADLDAAAAVAMAHEERTLAVREKQGHAAALVACASRVLHTSTRERHLRGAISAWAAAVRLVDASEAFADVSSRVQQLGEASAAMAEEMAAVQFAEAGGLAVHQMQLLHDTAKEVMISELHAAESAAAQAHSKYVGAASRLRNREDDLVLLIQSFETLKDEHKQLSERVAASSDGSAAHAARLQAELERQSRASMGKTAELAQLRTSAASLRERLELRERQLALSLTHIEAGHAHADVLQSKGSVEEAKLRGTLADYEEQLVQLVASLYELAQTERVPGVVAHDARSRVFRRCAVVYELIGEARFRQADPLGHNSGGARRRPRRTRRPRRPPRCSRRRSRAGAPTPRGDARRARRVARGAARARARRAAAVGRGLIGQRGDGGGIETRRERDIQTLEEMLWPPAGSVPRRMTAQVLKTRINLRSATSRSLCEEKVGRFHRPSGSEVWPSLTCLEARAARARTRLIINQPRTI